VWIYSLHFTSGYANSRFNTQSSAQNACRHSRAHDVWRMDVARSDGLFKSPHYTHPRNAVMITILTASLTTLLLVAIRLSVILLLSPIEAIRILPMPIRLIIVFIISLLLTAHMPSSSWMSYDTVTIFIKAAAEFFNGLLISLSLYAAFAAFQIAGQLLDTQIGLNGMSLINPSHNAEESISGRLLTLIAGLCFFTLNEHHYLLQGICISFEQTEPGTSIIAHGFEPIIRQCGLMFTLAILLAMPIIALLFIIDISAALFTRNMPQVSIFFLTLPLKILLGLGMFYLLLTELSPFIEQVFQASFEAIKRAIL
jgi:flagellar biosynthetic protein FliR